MCEDSILSFCRPLCPPGTAIAVAVSGGADSMALCYLLHALRESLKLSTMAIAHVNHGLRGECSDREEAFVREHARLLECPIHVQRLGGRDPSLPGMEAWARRQRYRFFARLRQEKGYRWIATGHTADDQAETVLMRLLRGSGLTGLSGIRPVRDDGIMRPILHLSRKQLLGWLERKNVPWCHDASNDDRRYRRNWLRHEVIPLLQQQFPGVERRLAEIADDAQDIRRFIQPAVNNWIRDNVIEKSDDHIVLKKPQSPHGTLEATEAVAQVLREKDIGFGRADILRLFSESRRSDGTFLLPGGWRFCPGRDRIAILRTGARPKPAAADHCRLRIPGTTTCGEHGWTVTASIEERTALPDTLDASNREVWLDAAAAGTELWCRTVEEKDQFHPLGAASPRSLRGYLKKQGVPRWERESVGVVARPEGAVVWIPAHALGHPFRVTEHTERVLRLSCRRNTSG